MSAAQRRAPRGAFEQHMLDAIALNEARAPLYSSLSNGASLAISRRLILTERALLPVARWFDRRALVWERAGIPILEEIFVPMHTAPGFAAPANEIHEPGNPALDLRVGRRVLRCYRDDDFAGAAIALREAIDALSAEPGMDCLVRHLLESAYRLAVLAPRHIRAAHEQRLPSPRWLLSLLLRLHLWGLRRARDLDALARPLQARGIPILAQDLPPISVP